MQGLNRFLIAALALALAAPAGVLSVAASKAPSENFLHLDDAPRRALALAAQARGVSGSEAVDLASELGAARSDLPGAVAAYYAVVIGEPLGAEDLAATLAQLDALSPGYRAGLAEILAAMTEAQMLRSRAFAGVSLAEMRFAYDTSMRSLYDPEALSAEEVAQALAILGRIDGARMIHAASLLHAAFADAIPQFRAALPPVSRIDTSFNAITIGGTGRDVYDVDKQLLIDPGGDDLYLNNEGGVTNRQVFDASGGCVFGGGTTGKASPNLGCTPLPGQVCTYDVANNAVGGPLFPDVSLPNNPPDGAGSGHDGSCGSDGRRNALVQDTSNANNDPNNRMVAALLDLGGSDTYTVPWTHFDPLFGLVDFCYPGDESKVNTNRDLFQGGTLGGVSLLWDDGAGNDFYRGRLNAQGSGHIGGVGMLFSTGSGRSFYWADRLSQGNGVAAGVGLLVDTKGGDNTYLLEPPIVYRNEFRPNGRDCAQEAHAGQGEGGFLGVGILMNVAQGAGHGHTVYRAATHLVNTAYPFAPLLDAHGRPALVGGTNVQGSGESFPIVDTPGGIVIGTGLLIDMDNGDPSVCPEVAPGIPGAGMISGGSYVTRSPGVVDRPCGKYNTPLEYDPQGELEDFFQHTFAGALAGRVSV